MRPDWDTYPCIPGAGAKHSQGYRQLNINGKQVLEHRVVFQQFYGYLPHPPNVVDHECRNRWCRQPYHLQEVTRAENTRLGTARRVLPERCPKDHLDWTYTKHGYRKCAECHRIQERERGRAKRAKANVR